MNAVAAATIPSIAFSENRIRPAADILNVVMAYARSSGAGYCEMTTETGAYIGVYAEIYEDGSIEMTLETPRALLVYNLAFGKINTSDVCRVLDRALVVYS